jgi:hypothetical protein
LQTQLNNPENIKFECLSAGDNSAALLPSNIIRDKPYFSMLSLFGAQVLVPLNRMRDIANSSSTQQLFGLKFAGKKLASIISQAFFNTRSGVSADHCGTGKEREVYNIVDATAVQGEPILNESESNESKIDQYKIDESNISVKVKYKELTYSIDISPDETIGTLRLKLLNQLGFEESKYRVRMILGGKVYQDDIQLSQLGDLHQKNMFQAVINPLSGGRRRRTMKRRKRKTKRRKNKRRKTRRH